MAERAKYFLLGLLLLVVAGLVAFEHWNSTPDEGSLPGSKKSAEDSTLIVQPLDKSKPGEQQGTSSKSNHFVDPQPTPTPAPEPKPEPAPKPPAPTPKPQPTREHVVVSGETLAVIAKHYYGTTRGVAWIVDANHITDPNRLYVKQKLLIPPAPTHAGTNSAAATRTKGHRTVVHKTARIPSVYTVHKGDGDLYAICRRLYGAAGLGARVAQVLEMNGLWSAEVTAGTALRLPPK